jgi:hypothetical protein
MKIYVSGPPVDSIDGSKEQYAYIYSLIREIANGEHEVIFPIRTTQLAKLDPRAFFEEISRRIGGAEAVISVIVAGDQSTPVEATVASTKGKPQSVIQIDHAPRLVQGLPKIVDIIKISSDDPKEQVRSIIENLTRSSPTPAKL